MTPARDWMPLITALAEKLFDDGLSAEEQGTLNGVLSQGPEQRGYYLAYANLLLALERRGRAAAPPTGFPFDVGQSGAPFGVIGSEVSISLDRQIETAPLPDFAVSGSLSTMHHAAVGYLSSDWPVAYLVATAVLAIGLLIGSLVHVSQPEKVAKQSVPPSTFGRGSESMLPSPFGRGAGGEGSDYVTHSRPTVGRITGMVDCRWAENPKAESRNPKQIRNHKSEITNPDSLVALGDRFALASGLMEITYDTGAKVILQGPVTYEVESEDSGYLSVGKLTARVETKTQDPRSKTENQSPNFQTSKSAILHPSSLIPHPLFAVRTPTATVTDLGTEFGVRVSEDGQSEVHVLRGLVEAEFMAAGTDGNHKVNVAAGEAVRLDRTRMAIKRFNASPSIFVRTIVRPPKTLPALIVADQFAYPDGPLDGNNGGSFGVGSFWSSGWFRSGSVTGGRIALPQSSVACRLFHPAVAGSSTGPIYFSARFTKTGATPKYALCLQLVVNSDDTTDYYDDATIGLVDDQYRVVLGGGSPIGARREFFGKYTPGQQVLIVGKLEFNVDGVNERLRAWTDPTAEETASVVSPAITADLGWTSPRCVYLRNWGGPTGTCFLSDLRIGYTWDAVVGPDKHPAAKAESRIMSQ